MNKIQLRKMVDAVCPKCKHPEYKLVEDEWLIRPIFKCDKCNHVWSYGYDGGKYFGLL